MGNNIWYIDITYDIIVWNLNPVYGYFLVLNGSIPLVNIFSLYKYQIWMIFNAYQFPFLKE